VYKTSLRGLFGLCSIRELTWIIISNASIFMDQDILNGMENKWGNGFILRGKRMYFVQGIEMRNLGQKIDDNAPFILPDGFVEDLVERSGFMLLNHPIAHKTKYNNLADWSSGNSIDNSSEAPLDLDQRHHRMCRTYRMHTPKGLPTARRSRAILLLFSWLFHLRSNYRMNPFEKEWKWKSAGE
jgi:hypothetical protein